MPNSPVRHLSLYHRIYLTIIPFF